jgi:hypothetical protein
VFLVYMCASLSDSKNLVVSMKVDALVADSERSYDNLV